MTGAMHSEYWYRVADLKPQLRRHVQLHRHYYRGRRCYLLQDQSNGSFHRFSPEAYFLIGQLDGRQTVNALWEAAIEKLGDDAPGQEQTLQLLGELHAADALQCDLPPDSIEVFERYTFGWTGFGIWLTVIVIAMALAGLHWGAITENILDRALNPWNLLILLLTYPVVKALHELGHAYATRVWGGEVHEMGIMFLVLMPIPYVDASAATAFQEKRRRIIVSAAGMMVEMFLAAAALFVWLNVETGIVSAVAYNVMLIGSVSTLFFNGNPLLRFDGYYMLADQIEIPNLATRANRYLSYLVLHYVHGMQDASSPVETHGEAAWFTFYGLASFIYRMFIMCVILLYVAGKFFIVGVLLALWAATLQLVLPLVRHVGFLLKDPRLQYKRPRALTVTGLGVALLAGLLFFVPAPLWTMAEGVVWLPEQSRIRAGADCFITYTLVEPGDPVKQGQAVFICDDPLLAAEVALLEARLRELEAQHTLKATEDRSEADSLRQDIEAVEAELAQARTELDDLLIKSTSSGTLIVPRADDLPGSFVHKGQILAIVDNDMDARARVVVTQNEIGLIRQRTRDVEVRIVDNPGEVITASIRQEVPAASGELPSKALGTRGGGTIPVDPNDESGTRALTSMFQFELALDKVSATDHFGQRVYVRFNHGSEPLALQWQRSLQQLFMRKFGV
jgi:putative peptide zinc metalloprotease protein